MAYAKRKKQKIKEFSKTTKFDEDFAIELKAHGSGKMLKALINTCTTPHDSATDESRGIFGPPSIQSSKKSSK